MSQRARLSNEPSYPNEHRSSSEPGCPNEHSRFRRGPSTRLRSVGYLATTGWPRSPTWRSRCSGRCCSRASPAPARPRWPRRWPRSLGMPLIRLQCYEGIDATQALYDWDFPRQILHLRTVEAAGAARRHRRARAVAVRRAVPAGPADPARAAREPGGAARRRDRPGRRRVRGVPARGALDEPGDHPRARHDHRGDAADRRAHLQPHPRAARRAQAPLPLPLDRAPGPRAGGRDRAQPAPRGQRRCSPSRSPRVVQRAAAARRAAQAARRRRDARLGPGAAPARQGRASTWSRRPPRSARCASTARTPSASRPLWTGC